MSRFTKKIGRFELTCYSFANDILPEGPVLKTLMLRAVESGIALQKCVLKPESRMVSGLCVLRLSNVDDHFLYNRPLLEA